MVTKHGSPLAPVHHSVDWHTPSDGDLIIPQFAHEDSMQFVTHLGTPPPHLLVRHVRLIWVRFPHDYRMVRVMDNGVRHGEIIDNHCPTGTFIQCPCDYCNLVKPYAHSNLP